MSKQNTSEFLKKIEDEREKLLDHIYKDINIIQETIDSLCEETLNVRKGLKILKNKRIDLEYLKCCEIYDQYKIICSYWYEITPKEFDLLKGLLK